MNDKVICITHNNCADGFAGAWVVRKALRNTSDITFYPGIYGQTPPDVTNKHVILVDFSYKRDILLMMAQKAASVLIIDHHKGAEEEFVDLPDNVEVVFDVEHSGSMLAWNYFFKSKPPKLLRHIEDRDLWKFKIPYTKEVQANLFSYPYDFDVWDNLMGAKCDSLVADGVAIQRKQTKDVLELLEVMKRRMNIAGHNVPVANLPYTLSSEAGTEMAKGEAFAACYFDVPDGVVFSLRSAPEGMDVSKIAKQYGGGGHIHAAGFKVSFAIAREFEINV